MKHTSANKIYYTYCLPLIFILHMFCACKKLVDIPEPVKTITTVKTFNNDANALSAVMAIYSNLSYCKNSMYFSGGLTTINAGMSADELVQFGNLSNPFFIYNLKENDAYGQFWQPAYYNVYMCNAVLEGLEASSTITPATKNILSGEARFLRAFNYFYLVNLFGDVPVITSTDFNRSSLLSRSPISEVYEQIVTDLETAIDLLPNDYSFTDGRRVRVTKWAAKALLSRVYLYTNRFADAETQATDVINNTVLFVLGSLNDIFLNDISNKEPILQWECINQNNFKYATQEANTFIPRDRTTVPKYYLTAVLLDAFENGDERKIQWIDSTVISGSTYYYPFKYKVRETAPGDNVEYYTPLRLGEQFLIRAEARARQQKFTDAISDLNVIRTRAGLSSLNLSLNESQVIDAVAQERRIELFAEWGHRWFDLKRTGRADAVLSAFKGTDWKTTGQLWPIPLKEIQTDPNLNQNDGY